MVHTIPLQKDNYDAVCNEILWFQNFTTTYDI